MPRWLEWVLLGGGAWLAGGTVVAFLLARVFAVTSAGNGTTLAAPPRFSVAERNFDSGRFRVLIVDDDAPLRSLLRATLSTGEFEVREVGSAERARDVIRSWRPGLVLLDVNLPGLDGLSFCAELAQSGSRDGTAVVLLTAEQISDTAGRLAGAKAVVRKPFSPLDLLALITRVVDEGEFVSGTERREDAQVLMYARDLASVARTERRQRQLLQDAYRQTAMALAEAVDVRDRGTGLHAQRVQRYALDLAEAVDPSLLGDPSLEYGFLLHDVGKIGISDDILLKRGPLNVEERELVHAHPIIGAQILHDVAMLQGGGIDVVRHHHERWDGAGYPDRLAGEQIPLGARIFAVADTLDAMTSSRPYRAALDWSVAVEEIQAQSGRQFDPVVVQAFLTEQERLRAAYEDLSLVA
ncbi:MAG TPA: HD domain-containing phosphohydrolase [Gaiellaceae bacterium]|nr:HD domain-containing phosphohydrolase [Gaiellaceae bacterium]